MGIYVPIVPFLPMCTLAICHSLCAPRVEVFKMGFWRFEQEPLLIKGLRVWLLPCKSLKSISLDNQRYNFWSNHFLED